MWLVATGLDWAHRQHFHHHRKFYQTGWNKPFQYSISFLRFEFSFETLPTLIPTRTWMICFSQCSESPSRIDLNQRKTLMASHEYPQDSFLYRKYFEWFRMVTQCHLYVIPGTPQSPASASTVICLSMDCLHGKDVASMWETRRKVVSVWGWYCHEDFCCLPWFPKCTRSWVSSDKWLLWSRSSLF